MKIKLNSYTHSLVNLENSGCKVSVFWKTLDQFRINDMRSPCDQMEVHILPIPDDWDCDNHGWAPEGYSPLGLSALIAVGIEYPNLQKTMTITATLAVSDYCSVSFPVYACLRTDEKSERVLNVDGSGFVPFCIRNSGSSSYELVGLFVKKSAARELALKYSTSGDIPALLGGSVNVTSGSGVFCSMGKWYRAGSVSEPQDSMIEAMNTAMLGGITVHDMSYIFSRYGTSLGECFEQNPKAVLKFLEEKEEQLRKIEDGTANHQYRDDLKSVIECQTQAEQTQLRDAIAELVKRCEYEMERARIPLDEPFYKETTL